MFFGIPTLLDATSVAQEGQASILSLPLQPTCQNGGSELINLLLVSKEVYKKAAPELYQAAWIVAEPEKITTMVVHGRQIACSPGSSRLALDLRVGPEDNIRSLTIFSKCGASDASNHNTEVHAKVARKLRAAVALFRDSFPLLENLVVQVSHYQDLISGSAVLRFVSPLCCLRHCRPKTIQFVAQDVRDRTQARAAGKEIKGASRLRIEVMVLAALTYTFTKSCDAVSEREHLHKDGRCIYRGPDAGVRFQRNVLAQTLKRKHRVKVATLM